MASGGRDESMYKNKCRRMLVSAVDIFEQWKEQFEELLNLVS